MPEHARLARRGAGGLENDHEFLLRGDVFTPDVIDTWIWYKTENEVDALRLARIPTSSASTSTSKPLNGRERISTCPHQSILVGCVV